jgi:hypothetical protein
MPVIIHGRLKYTVFLHDNQKVTVEADQIIKDTNFLEFKGLSTSHGSDPSNSVHTTVACFPNGVWLYYMLDTSNALAE